MTNRFWGFKELVSTIAAILVSSDASASAVALATCCKSFEELALSEVWRRLVCLEPLVNFLPLDAWDVGISWNSGLLPAKWTRFQQVYASKVRHMDVTLSDDTSSFTSLHVLQLYASSDAILPNLVSLYWEADDAVLPLLPMLFSRSLSSVEIGVGKLTILPPILNRLLESSPNVSQIEVARNCYQNSMSICGAASGFLMKCNPRFIRKYAIDSPISTPAFIHLLQLPSLAEVSLVLDKFQLPDSMPPVVFPSLQFLPVRYRGEPTWLKLFPLIGSMLLTTIHLSLPEGSNVEQFMRTFQQTLVDCNMHHRLKGFRMKTEADITPQILACSFSFVNLTSLELLSDCITCYNPRVCRTELLTDDDIDSLTRAMPRLEYLLLGEPPCEWHSRITVKSLHMLSRRCPRLTTLRIHFNRRSLIERGSKLDLFDSGDQTPPLELSFVKKIEVGMIKKSLHGTATLGLRNIFPQLEEMSLKFWDDIEFPCN